MDWDNVRIFLAVAREGQLLSASRRLGLNHATLGRRINALEEQLRTRLLIRKPSGCDLTAEGHAFYATAERMEAEMLAAQARAGNVDAPIDGIVRIGAPDGFGVSFLAPRLGPLMRRHPNLRIQLVPVPRSFSLSSREADIAITVEQPSQGRLICARNVNAELAARGIRGTGSAWARSFLTWGRRGSGQVGDVAVFSRGKRGGHVAIVAGFGPNGERLYLNPSSRRQAWQIGPYHRQPIAFRSPS